MSNTSYLPDSLCCNINFKKKEKAASEVLEVNVYAMKL